MQKVAVQGLERHLLGSSPAVKRLRSVIKMRDDYESMFAEVIDEGIRDGLFVDLAPCGFHVLTVTPASDLQGPAGR